MKQGVIKPEHLVVALLVVIILGASLTLPSIVFDQAYSELTVVADWTVVASDTPVQTAAPSSTLRPSSVTLAPSPSPSPTSLSSSPTPENTNCVFPAEYWEEHPELWLEIMVGS